VELRTTGRPAERGLDPSSEQCVSGLANHRRNFVLRLVAEALVWQPGSDRVGRHDPLGVEIDLVVKIEAVNVVMHAVEQMKAAIGQDETGPLLPDEDLLRSLGWGVQLGIHRRGDDRCREQRLPRGAVGAAGIRQVDPTGRIQLPACPRIAWIESRDLVAGELGDLPREASYLHAGLDEAPWVGSGFAYISDSLGEAGDHPCPAELRDTGQDP